MLLGHPLRLGKDSTWSAKAGMVSMTPLLVCQEISPAGNPAARSETAGRAKCSCGSCRLSLVLLSASDHEHGAAEPAIPLPPKKERELEVTHERIMLLWTGAHPHCVQRVSVLADDAWGGFAVLTAEMCRPEVIVLVCKGGGGELNQALIINYYLLFIIII